MKIVQLTGDFPPILCGVGSYTQHLSRALAEQGAEVYVITSADNQQPDQVPGVSVLPMMEHWRPSAWAAMRECLEQIQPDIVHVQYQIATFDDGSLIYTLPYRSRWPVVTTFHDYATPVHLGKPGKALVFSQLFASRQVIVTHDKPYMTFRKVPLLNRKLNLIPIGSNIPVAAPTLPAAETAPHEPVLLFFGFIWRGKNVEQLIRLLRYLLDKGIATQLRIVGDIQDQAYYDEMQHLAQELGVAGRLHFTGELADQQVSEELHQADLGVFPFTNGISTGHGTTIAAFEHGLPVVTTATPELTALKTYFKDRQNIMMTPLGDETAFQNAVYELLTTPSLMATLKRNLDSLAHAFSWTDIAQRHIKTVYARITG